MPEVVEATSLVLHTRPVVNAQVQIALLHMPLLPGKTPHEQAHVEDAHQNAIYCALKLPCPQQERGEASMGAQQENRAIGGLRVQLRRLQIQNFKGLSARTQGGSLRCTASISEFLAHPAGLNGVFIWTSSAAWRPFMVMRTARCRVWTWRSMSLSGIL